MRPTSIPKSYMKKIKAIEAKKKTVKQVHWVCQSCGNLGNYLTCLVRYGAPPEKPQAIISTWHNGICDICGYRRPVTEDRDFFYPDWTIVFALLIKYSQPRQKPAPINHAIC